MDREYLFRDEVKYLICRGLAKGRSNQELMVLFDYIDALPKETLIQTNKESGISILENEKERIDIGFYYCNDTAPRYQDYYLEKVPKNIQIQDIKNELITLLEKVNEKIKAFNRLSNDKFTEEDVNIIKFFTGMCSNKGE